VRVYFYVRYTFMWAISMTSCFVYRRMLLLPFIVAKFISSAFAVYGWYSVSLHTQSSSLANGRDVRRWLWAIGDVCSDVFCAASFALACSVFRGEFLLIHVYTGN
jgi:hypothetical protein